MKPYDSNVTRIRKALGIARKNWKKWIDVFRHNSPISTNPLLAQQKMFASFCKEYSVHRTIRGGKQNDFRRTLQESPGFRKAISAGCGRELDRIEGVLRKDFGTRNGRNHMIPVFSKVAAFLRPDRFVEWDRYAKNGLYRVLGPNASLRFKTYAEYLAAFDHAWRGRPGKFQAYADRATSPHRGAVEREPRFQRRGF